MAQNQTYTAHKQVKRHLHKGRVAAVLLIFIGICVLIGNIGGCSDEKDKKNTTLPADNTVTESTDETVTEVEDGTLIVCIDAGHGGSDPGSISNYTQRFEKDDNLSVALATQKYLEQSDIDMEILMTRTDDTFITLDDRCSLANNANADLFVSLHRNSADDANGVEVWVHNEEPAADCRLAYNILVELENVGISRNKGVRFGYITDPDLNYQVNRETNMPSCLVELGFMSSVEDNTLFDTHVDEYGKAVADAVIKTAKELELKGLKSDKKIEPIETEYYNYDVSDYIPDPSVGDH